MEYVIWFILGFAFLRLLIAVVNHLSKSHPEYKGLQASPLLSVLIPARNEEHNIGSLLDDLTKQDYSNIEILVYDDVSEDNTKAIVKEKAEKDQRISYMEGMPLPNGWNGKNYACHQLAQAATGHYFLFLDADVRVGNGLFKNTLSMAEKHSLQLLSIFPKQEMKTFGEKITVPVMNWILTSLLPLPLVLKSKRPSLAAANGQFMLFEKENYRKQRWHEAFKKEKAEDIAIMKSIKKNGFRGLTLLGDDSIRCRMYSGFEEAIEGFSKNVNAYFGNNYLLTLLFTLLTTFGFLPVLLYADLFLLLIYLATILSIRLFTSLAGKQNALINLLLLPLQQAALVIMVASSVKKSIRKDHQWKGRKI